jgi:hypothetical protein
MNPDSGCQIRDELKMNRPSKCPPHANKRSSVATPAPLREHSVRPIDSNRKCGRTDRRSGNAPAWPTVAGEERQLI